MPDRPRVGELCDEPIALVHREPEPYRILCAMQILEALRDGRHFGLRQQVADAFVQSGRDTL